MEKMKASTVAIAIDLKELQSTCKSTPPGKKRNTEHDLRRGGSLQNVGGTGPFLSSLHGNQILSDLSTEEYLEKFREGMIRKLYRVSSRKSIALMAPPSSSSGSEGSDYHPHDSRRRKTGETRRDKVSLPPSESLRSTMANKFSVNMTRLTAGQVEDAKALNEFWHSENVDISDNALTSIEHLGILRYLKVLDASRNCLTTFIDIKPPVPTELCQVDFSWNGISSIVRLQEYWAVTYINLSHNELTSTEGFGGLEYLQILDLSCNQIETLGSLDCPNLICLRLDHNKLVSILEYVGCPNLRFLDLQKNSLSRIEGLKYLSELTELNLRENNLEDVSELEYLKSLKYLTRLKIQDNPIQAQENWRILVTFWLPQLLWIDELPVEPSELRAAAKLFHPSHKEQAYSDYATAVLDRACQSGNQIFDSYCENQPTPPILLIVGPPRCNAHNLTFLLKQRFRNEVYLGGVHSTATTIEGSNPKLDIPVSYESFRDMKRRGEFLATGTVLGRVVGFAESQISRATEKGSLLIAAVPLEIAFSLRDCWGLNAKLVLVLPSVAPIFHVDDERSEVIERSIRGSLVVEEPVKVPSAAKIHWEKDETLSPHDGVLKQSSLHATDSFQDGSNTRRHSILKIRGKTPENDKKWDERSDVTTGEEGHAQDNLKPEKQRINFSFQLGPEEELKRYPSILKNIGDGGSRVGSEDDLHSVHSDRSVRLRSSPDIHGILDLEQKKRRLRSLGAGKERYSDDGEEEEATQGDHKGKDATGKHNEWFDGHPVNIVNIEASIGGDSTIERSPEEIARVAKDRERERTASHKEAMLHCVIQTKKAYKQFHVNNPGFFHAVIDTADMCTSYRVVENIVIEVLTKQKEEKLWRDSYPKQSGEGTRTYAGLNTTDANNFLHERINKLKKCSILWNKGLDTNNNSGVQGTENSQSIRHQNKSQEQVEMLAQVRRHHTNLLDPKLKKATLPTLKMKRIVEMHEKREKFNKK